METLQDKVVQIQDNTVTFRDRVSNVTAKGLRKWVYAAKPSGKWYKLEHGFLGFTCAFFFALPLIKYNGMPFFMLNFPEAKFIVFGNIFWPQDFFIFAVAMITFIVFVALFTVIYGRLFCGWICPQTVFMEMVFRKIEWLIEGNHNKQRKNANETYTTQQSVRKFIKHVVFLVLSFVIANTFLSYVLGLDGLLKIIHEPISEHLLLLTGLVFFTLLFYAVYAFVRDIVCTTVCPYGRLQSVLFDKDTMQISYDYKRGEPRGKLAKDHTQNIGDCVDCKKCVQVCPTGIDIRDGIQIECVGCTACIDACNEVMLKLNRPKGLIRYASENEIAKGKKIHFNGRMKAYTALLCLLIVVMSILVVTRRSIDTTITRASGQLYQEIGTDSLSNLFNAKVLNKTNKDFNVEMRLENMPGNVVMVNNTETHIHGEAVNDLTFFVKVNKRNVTKRSIDVLIGVYKEGKKIQTVTANFLGPFM
jgi:cytochrome c oxidase accessory protein FixG